MITDNSETYLRLFSNGELEVDKSLPKWRPENLDEQDLRSSFEELLQTDAKDFNIYLAKETITALKGRAERMGNPRLSDFLDLDMSLSYDNRIEKNPIKRWWNNYKKKQEEEKAEMGRIDVLGFFGLVKGLTKSEESTYITRLEPLLVALKHAQEMGQQSLVDELTMKIFLEKYESLLYAKGYLHRVTERDVVEFYKKVKKDQKKALKLNYIKNFSRPIPEDVREKKRKADELLIFDNYVVLHYDPKDNGAKKTAEEEKKDRERKMDPILFGVIQGSHNLYYIADWTDEFCDLTLDKFLEVMKYKKEDVELARKIKC